MVDVFGRHGVRFDPRTATCNRFVRYSDYAALEAQLAEALKALEPFAKAAPVFDHQRLPAPCEDHHTVYKWETKGTGEVEITVADFRAARRVREGGKVDG